MRAIYQARKFVRRNRVAVAATLGLVAALLGGGAATAFQWRAASLGNERLAIAAEEKAVALEAMLRAEENARRAVENELIAGQFADALWERASRHFSFSISPREREEFWDGVRADFVALAKEHGEENPIARRERARVLLQTGAALGGIRSGNQGDFASALEAFEMARDELVTLRAEKPDDLGIWADVVDAQLQVADALRQLNRPSDALNAYELAIAFAEEVSSDPEELAIARQQSKPRFAMAQVALTLGKRDLARVNFEIEVKERRRRAAAHPEDANAARDLYVALFNYGELLRLSGDSDAARGPLSESLELREALLERRPSHPTLRRDTAIALFGMAINELDRGSIENAGSLVDRAGALLKGLVDERPDDARNHATLAFGYAEAAEAAIAEETGALFKAWIEELTRATQNLESSSISHPDLPELRARRLMLEAERALLEGEPDLACERFELCRDQFAALAAIDPADMFAQIRLGDSLVGVARSILESNRTDDDVRRARSLLQEASRIFHAAGDTRRITAIEDTIASIGKS
ncbi:MAG: hypothetical protein VYC34_09985 [Planctomycetota bacterium]|nr:hypothetical protein [Planctomycetota bacterium]